MELKVIEKYADIIIKYVFTVIVIGALVVGCVYGFHYLSARSFYDARDKALSQHDTCVEKTKETYYRRWAEACEAEGEKSKDCRLKGGSHLNDDYNNWMRECDGDFDRHMKGLEKP